MFSVFLPSLSNSCAVWAWTSVQEQRSGSSSVFIFMVPPGIANLLTKKKAARKRPLVGTPPVLDHCHRGVRGEREGPSDLQEGARSPCSSGHSCRVRRER